MDFIRYIFSFWIDSHYYKKKEKSGKKLTWWDIIFPPVLKIALFLGFLLGLIKLIIYSIV
jgi:hypothetical protein